MNEYERLLIEEQFMTRLKNTFLSTIGYYDKALQANKYDVEANKKLPLAKRDYKKVSKICAILSAQIITQVEEKYNVKFESITIKRDEPEPQEESMPQINR